MASATLARNAGSIGELAIPISMSMTKLGPIIPRPAKLALQLVEIAGEFFGNRDRSLG